MRIGEFAIFAGTSASTVRYYEQIGLLPAPKRIRNNQRLAGLLAGQAATAGSTSPRCSKLAVLA
jgi:hypothetical protein